MYTHLPAWVLRTVGYMCIELWWSSWRYVEVFNAVFQNEKNNTLQRSVLTFPTDCWNPRPYKNNIKWTHVGYSNVVLSVHEQLSQPWALVRHVQAGWSERERGLTEISRQLVLKYCFQSPKSIHTYSSASWSSKGHGTELVWLSWLKGAPKIRLSKFVFLLVVADCWASERLSVSK